MATGPRSPSRLLRPRAPATSRARTLGTTPLGGVAVGVALIVVAGVIKLGIARVAGADVAYLPLFAVLPAGVIVGGIPAGVTITLLGVSADAVIFEDIRGPAGLIDPSNLARFLLFIPTALWMTLLIGSLARLRREAGAEADRLRQIVRAFPGFALLADPATGVIRFASEGLERLGWDPDALVGRTVGELLPDASLEPGGGGSTVGLLRPSGDELSVEVIGVKVTLDGAEDAVLLVARDVSAQAEQEFHLLRLAAAERRTTRSLQAVIASMDAGVALIAPDGAVTLANDALTLLAGGPVARREELADRLGTDLAPGEVHVPGSGRWLRIAIHEIEGDELVIIRDLTADREAAAAQEAFMGILSHELRTPVTTILGLAHVLGRGRGNRDRTVELAAEIGSEAERLAGLIDDLLVLSRSQGGRVTFEPEPILVQHAITEVITSEVARFPRVRFVTELDRDLPPAEGDGTFLLQVLRNIIGNAAKYGPTSGSTVTVVARASDGMVEVVVRDEGPGFDPEDADRLFDIFFRSSRTARARAGSGIGLFVSRTLVEAMHGRIWARLRPEGGSEFGFALPVLAAEEDVND